MHTTLGNRGDNFHHQYENLEVKSYSQQKLIAMHLMWKVYIIESPNLAFSVPSGVKTGTFDPQV